MSDGLCQGQLSVHVHQRETVRQRPSTLQRRWVPRIVFIECCIIDTVVLYIYHSPTLTCTKDFVDFPALRAERVLKTKDLHANPANFGGKPSRHENWLRPPTFSLVQYTTDSMFSSSPRSARVDKACIINRIEGIDV